MTIERFIWTIHAEERLPQRGLTRARVERAIQTLHPTRETNEGEADWRVDAGRFVVITTTPTARMPKPSESSASGPSAGGAGGTSEDYPE